MERANQEEHLWKNVSFGLRFPPHAVAIKNDPKDGQLTAFCDKKSLTSLQGSNLDSSI